MQNLLELIQSKFDEFTETINGMHEEFHENGSEIETVARESICETVRHIVKHFAHDIQAALLRNREW